MTSIYSNISNYVKNKLSNNSAPDSKETSRMAVFCIVSIVVVFIIFNLFNTHLFKILLGVFIGIFVYKHINK